MQITVGVRLRAVLPYESVVSASGPTVNVATGTVTDRARGPKQYAVDHCFDGSADTAEVYRRQVAPLVRGVCEGVNAVSGRGVA